MEKSHYEMNNRIGLEYFLLHTSFYSILKEKIEWIRNALMVRVIDDVPSEIIMKIQHSQKMIL